MEGEKELSVKTSWSLTTFLTSMESPRIPVAKVIEEGYIVAFGETAPFFRGDFLIKNKEQLVIIF